MSQKILSLRQNSAELRAALLDGTLRWENQLWSVLPREVASHPIGLESVIFEVTPTSQLEKPNTWRVALQAIRPMGLGLALAPVLAVLVSDGWSRGWIPSHRDAVLVIFSILCLQLAVHLLNDVEDHLRLVDRPGMVGGSGVLQRGWVSARVLRVWGWAFWGLAIALGLPLLELGSGFLVFLGLVGVFGVAQFSSGPWALRYRAVGDFIVFLLTGPVLTVGAAQAVFHRWDLSDFVLGFFFGLTSWASFHSKHLQTFEADRQSGASNWAIWIGYKRSRYFLLVLYAMAYVSLGLGSIWGGIPLRVFQLVILCVPLIYRQVLRVYQASGPVSVHLCQMRTQGLKIQIFLSLLALIGFFLKF